MEMFPNFDEMDVSTKTIIAVTNINLRIDELFEKLPITEYQVVPKRRGRKKRDAPVDPNLNLASGSIITLKMNGNLRGVDLKAGKKSKSAKKGFFRNSMTVVMLVDGKIINFKISDNGKFQITGCKSDEHVVNLIKHFYGIMQATCQDCFSIDGNFYAVFMTVMTNIDFNLGFQIDREKLDKWINTNTRYNSLLETSFGYTGVNIKIPFTMPQDFYLKKISYIKGADESVGEWKETRTSYSCYVDMLGEKERRKELAKSRYNTFLVFHSGNCIFSSMNKDFMQNYYNEFIDIIKQCRPTIEEVIA
jgi:hypothetical protein